MNCLNLQYSHFSMNAGIEQQQFFSYCKKQQLHKFISTESTSRLHSIYDGNEFCIGFEAVIAYENSEPIAISFVEMREQHNEKATNMVNQEQTSIYNMGFLHFYVKDMFRNLGIASDMAEIIEKQCLNKLKKEIYPDVDVIPIFVSQEGAFGIAKRATKWSHVISSDMLHRRRQLELDIIKSDIDDLKTDKKSYKNFSEIIINKTINNNGLQEDTINSIIFKQKKMKT